MNNEQKRVTNKNINIHLIHQTYIHFLNKT